MSSRYDSASELGLALFVGPFAIGVVGKIGFVHVQQACAENVILPEL